MASLYTYQKVTLGINESCLSVASYYIYIVAGQLYFEQAWMAVQLLYNYQTNLVCNWVHMEPTGLKDMFVHLRTIT